MSAVDSVGSFEEYLVKHGKIDEANAVRTGAVGGNQDSPVVAFAKANDIFTAEKQFAPTNNPTKEASGAGAASSGGGGFIANVVSAGSNFVMANLDIDAPTMPGVNPAVAGENPVMASALQQPSGSESSDGQDGATSNNPNDDVTALYNQYLQELNQAEIADEEGIPETTGEATLSVGDETPSVESSENGESTPVGDVGDKTLPEPAEDVGEVNDGTVVEGEETSSDIDAQQEKQLQAQQEQKNLEEQLRQSRFFNNA